MANKVKKSFGKSSLRLSSMILAVLMLVLATFTGITPTVVNAQTANANVIAVTDYAWVLCGQNVELEAGKTYAYSYYYSGPNDVSGVIYDGNDQGNTPITPTNTVYEYEYKKVTYEFVAPDTATPATEEGKVVIYLGIQIPSKDTYYFYQPCVYAIDDETKTNLFEDYNFTGKYTLEGLGGTKGNWHKPYADKAGKLGYKFSRPTLDSVGGMDIFKKPSNVISVTDYAWVQCGQNVELEAGKTYAYSFYYSGPKTVLGKIYDGNDQGNTSITVIDTIYDYEYKKITYQFVAPDTATPGEEEGKVKIYLGIQIPSKDTYYYYHPCVYALDDENQTNLFNDYLFTGKYTLEGLGGIQGNWHKPYAGTSGKLGSKFSRPNLDSLGGMDVFKKTDAERYVVKLAAGSTPSTAYIGQKLSVAKGETYTLSYYYTGVDPSHLIRINDGSYREITADEITYDTELYKKNITFTVPAEETVDQVPLWVGIRPGNNSVDTYFYDFRLYNVKNPENNLLNVASLFESDTSITSGVWCQPSKALNSSWYSKTTLEAAGGMNIFKKPTNVLAVTDYAWVQCGQNVELEAGKTYSYSFYYYGPKAVSGVIYDGNDLGDTSIAPTKVVYDEEYSKVTYEFVAPETATPATEEGKVVIYLGIQIPSKDTYYFYHPCVYAIDDETKTNLFYDYYFTGKYTLEGLNGTKGNWHKPYADASGKLGYKFSRPNLDSLGDINLFLSFAKKCDVTLDDEIDIRDLVRMKRFSVGLVESLPEYRGDLNCDTTIADAADLVLLRKEILK